MFMDAHSKCTAMEASQILIKEEKTRLETELDEVKLNFDNLKIKETKQRHELDKYVSLADKEKAEHESKMLILQQQLDQERSKLQTAMENIKEKERQWALLGRNDNNLMRSSPIMSNRNSVFTNDNDGSDTETLGPAPGDLESMTDINEYQNLRNSMNTPMDLMDSVISKTTTYEAVKNKQTKEISSRQSSQAASQGLNSFANSISSQHTSQTGTNSNLSHSSMIGPQVLSTSVFESMQAQLKTREGELTQLLSQVEAFKRSRLHMSEEIVQLSNQVETLKNVEKKNLELQNKLNSVEKKHNLTLSLLGEKTEQIEELKMDLMDVKEMFKMQTEQLVRKIGGTN